MAPPKLKPTPTKVTEPEKEAEQEFEAVDSRIDSGNAFQDVLDEVIHGKPLSYDIGTELIYTAICNVMRDIDAIVKTREPGSKVPFAFRSIETIMNKIHPILVRHKVFIVPITRDHHHERLVGGNGRNQYQAIVDMGFRAYTVDGSYIEGAMVAESIDSSDKATQQAVSYCYKDFICKTFCIPTEDVQDDGDGKLADIQGFTPVSEVAGRVDKLSSLPKLADRPPVQEIAQTQAIPDVQPTQPAPPVTEYVTESGWNLIYNLLERFQLNENQMLNWQVSTLRGAHYEIPANMVELPKAAGAYLYKVAKASNEQGNLLTSLSDAL